jgi:hypothetical protein
MERISENRRGSLEKLWHEASVQIDHQDRLIKLTAAAVDRLGEDGEEYFKHCSRFVTLSCACAIVSTNERYCFRYSLTTTLS